MSIKMSSALFSVFFVDPEIWGDCAYVDDTLFLLDGEDKAITSENLKACSEVEIVSGFLFDSKGEKDPQELVKVAEKWLTSTKTKDFTIHVDEKRVEELENLLKEKGFIL